MNQTDIKKKIKKKYKNISRFSTLSGIPYHFIQNAFKKKNPEQLARIAEAIEATENRAVFDEVDQITIERVKAALSAKDLVTWCRENGVNKWWLEQFLAGEIRFKTHYRVKRLFSLLDIK